LNVVELPPLNSAMWCADMIMWVQILKGKHYNNFGGQKMCKNQCDFGQLQSLTANICEIDWDIKNWNSRWSTTAYLA